MSGGYRMESDLVGGGAVLRAAPRTPEKHWSKRRTPEIWRSGNQIARDQTSAPSTAISPQVAALHARPVSTWQSPLRSTAATRDKGTTVSALRARDTPMGQHNLRIMQRCGEQRMAPAARALELRYSDGPAPPVHARAAGSPTAYCTSNKATAMGCFQGGGSHNTGIQSYWNPPR